jgi:hypothetical protein
MLMEDAIVDTALIISIRMANVFKTVLFHKITSMDSANVKLVS